MSCAVWTKAKLLSRLSFLGITVAALFNLSSLKAKPLRTQNSSRVVVEVKPDLYHYQYWKNDFDVVHVVHTRFMQHQPGLLALGRARLALFETFCLPTMTNQTTSQFLWIIRADSNLRQELKEGIVNIVRGHENIVIVGSNEAPDKLHFRDANAIRDITNSSLWSGNMQVVEEYHRAAQTRTLLETGLDADDGLALDLLRRLQQVGADRKGATWWRIWCTVDHIEWHFFNPYRNYPIKKAGQLRNVSADSLQVCPTPGLTRGSAVSVQAAHANPMARHIDQLGNHYFERHDMVRKLRRCSKQYRTACWGYIPSVSLSEKQAIRSRTPTSAGMKGIGPTIGKNLDEEVLPRVVAFWNVTMFRFALSETSIRRATKEMREAMPLILNDAIQGQCTEGHSCKNTSTQTLQKLLKTASS